MAYIKTSEVSAIRHALKEKFPKIKFSVRRQDNHAVSVAIMKAPFNFEALPEHIELFNGCRDINIYHLHEYGIFDDLFRNILDTIKKAPANVEGGREWFDESDSMTDYFHTAFYIDLSIGRWDKPFQEAK